MPLYMTEAAQCAGVADIVSPEAAVWRMTPAISAEVSASRPWSDWSLSSVYGGKWLPVAAAMLSASAASAAAPAKSPDPCSCDAKRVQIERQFRERAGLADDFDKPQRDRQKALLVPHGGGSFGGS
jgi:hypothetical protein